MTPPKATYTIASVADVADTLRRVPIGTLVVCALPERHNAWVHRLRRSLFADGLKVRSRRDGERLIVWADSLPPRLTGEGLDPDWNIEWELP